jgi:hypothetical protein
MYDVCVSLLIYFYKYMLSGSIDFLLGVRCLNSPSYVSQGMSIENRDANKSFLAISHLQLF